MRTWDAIGVALFAAILFGFFGFSIGRNPHEVASKNPSRAWALYLEATDYEARRHARAMGHK